VRQGEEEEGSGRVWWTADVRFHPSQSHMRRRIMMSGMSVCDVAQRRRAQHSTAAAEVRRRRERTAPHLPWLRGLPPACARSTSCPRSSCTQRMHPQEAKEGSE
jgi:hypothetical protein